MIRTWNSQHQNNTETSHKYYLDVENISLAAWLDFLNQNNVPVQLEASWPAFQSEPVDLSNCLAAFSCCEGGLFLKFADPPDLLHIVSDNVLHDNASIIAN